MIYVNKKWCKEELRIMIEGYKKEIDEMKSHPDEYDADFIGDCRATREMATATTILGFVDMWPDRIRDDMVYEVLETLNHGYPLTPLNSFEDVPDEWEDRDGKKVNKRYGVCQDLLGYLTYADGHYSDCSRLKIYDLLTDSYSNRHKFKQMFGTIEVYENIMKFFDELVPIKFPYVPQSNKATMYCEIINEDDIKTIAICYINSFHQKEPTKIMRFFDVCESGALDEIDQTTYIIDRKKKYEDRKKKEHEAQIKAAEEITEKGITDPAEKADILNAARKEVNDEDSKSEG